MFESLIRRCVSIFVVVMLAVSLNGWAPAFATDDVGSDPAVGSETPTSETSPPAPDPAPDESLVISDEPAPADSTAPEPSQPADSAAPAEPAVEEPAAADPVLETPTIASNKADYPPGGLVLLSGDGWSGDDTVRIVVNDTYGASWKRDVQVSVSNGAIADEFNLPDWFVSDYDVKATGLQSGRVATATFTDAAGATLDQCANGTFSSPESCKTPPSQWASNWVNGNLNGSKSHYNEGDSIPYRLAMTDITSGATHTVVIAWDTMEGGKHAIDYLTTYNRTVTDAMPCAGFSWCTGAGTTFGIPTDPSITGFTPISGVFTLWGGSITSVVYGLQDGGNCITTATPVFSASESRCAVIKYDATSTNALLAWGGHIATRQDWGANNSAVSISGSPYHTRLLSLDGTGGNQDRSLSSDAVFFPATITIVKHADPPSDQTFSFTGTPVPATDFTLTDNAADGDASKTFTIDDPNELGTFTFTESSTSGWALQSLVCTVVNANGGTKTVTGAQATVAPEEGESWTCTYTNKQQTGTLTVKKVVVNDAGGTGTSADWSIHVKKDGTEATGSPQAGTTTGTTYTLPVGSYTVSETGGLAGYELQGISGDCAADGSVTVIAGQNKTCTLTNVDVAPKLKLVKVVSNDDGGTAAAADFTLTATAPGAVLPLITTAGDAGTLTEVMAGVAYTLGESGPDGYKAGDWSCDGGTQDGSSITLGLDETVVCTVVNNDVAPKLKLVKVVSNDDGGSRVPDDWTLTATAAAPDGGRDVSTAGGSDTALPVFAGVAYTLGESGPDGYKAGDWSCDGGTQDGSSITLGLDETVVCTVVNDDVAPKLKLVKVVSNDDGGSRVPDDWMLTATAAAPDGGRDVSTAGGSDMALPVFAGVAYTLGESGPDGYKAGDWSCDGGTQDGSSITLGLDETVTCTVVNDDKAPKLKLVKDVTNDDGGTAAAADFTLTATAGGATVITTAGDAGTLTDVRAGVEYTLGESGPDGYKAGAWSCDGGTQDGSSITLGLDETVTCTIVNNDKAPKLKLVKVVSNDDGGTAAAADFTLTATAPGAVLPLITTAGDAGTLTDVKAGVAYTLGESGPDGYKAGDWSCDGGTQDGSSITLGLDETVVCTVVNDDKAPKLKLVKDVTNDDGGTAAAADFTLTATGDGATVITTAGDAGTLTDVMAGVAYTLGESGPDGYKAGDWSCDGGTLTGSSITLGLDETVTCTVVNDDMAPKLKLVKVVSNDDGGTAAAADFTLTATAPGAVFPLITTAGDAGTLTDVMAGVAYTLGESGPDGYAAGSWSCNGGTLMGSSITLGLDETVTCTIVNNDKAPKLTLVKKVSGGSGAPNDWDLTAAATGNPDSRNFTDKGGSGVAHNVWAGASYSLSESGPTGYTASDWVCTGGGTQTGSTITLGLGDKVTCEITNTRDRGSIELQKQWSGTPGTVTLKIGSTTGGTNVASTSVTGDGTTGAKAVDTGTYFVSESALATYDSTLTCSSDQRDSITANADGGVMVNKGEHVVCVYVNTRHTGDISVTKFHDRNANGVRNDGDGGLSGWTFWLDLDGDKAKDAGEPTATTGADGTALFDNVDTGSYTVCEVTQAGWNASLPRQSQPCITVTVTKNATATVTFGNYRKGRISVVKTFDGGPVPTGKTYTFQIRSGASTTSAGTVVATGSVTGPDGTIDPTEWRNGGWLEPGTYSLCEVVSGNQTPNWVQELAYGDNGWFTPGIAGGSGFQEGENTLACINFTVVSTEDAETVVFQVNNVPKGFAHTIGYWKNWTSCDGAGNQFAMLDLMIKGGTAPDGRVFAPADDSNGNGLPDIRIGDIYIEGANACKIAVDILDKRLVGDPAKVGDKPKQAGDAIINSTAQLLAYELNQLLNNGSTGQAACEAKADQAAALMQRFLDYINYSTTGYKAPTTTLATVTLQTTQIKANMLYLAEILDDYNNNTMSNCSTAISLPYPRVGNSTTLWVNYLPASKDT